MDQNPAVPAAAPAPNPFSQIPVPKVPPYMEVEGAPTLDFREWANAFTGMMRMMELRAGAPFPDNVKNWTLLTHLGVRGQKIVSNSTAQAQVDTATYVDFFKSVTDLFVIEQSQVKSWVDFERRTQKPGESIDSFYSDLQCLFASTSLPDGAGLDVIRPFFLMVRLVAGCSDSGARQELLSRRDLTLDRVLQYLRARETAISEAAALNPFVSGSPEVHKVDKIVKPPPNPSHKKKPDPNAKISCIFCGTSHLYGKKYCPAWEKTCVKCGEQNHFPASLLCAKNPKNPKKSEAKTKRLSSSSTPAASEPILIQVQLGPDLKHLHSMDLEADSAAEVTLLSHSTAVRIFSNNIQFGSSTVRNYDGSTVSDVIGSVSATVKFQDRLHVGVIHIVPDGFPELLGKNFLIPLKVTIQCGTASVFKATVDPNSPFAAFPGLLSDELGTFKGDSHRIQLKSDAVPRAVAVRPIPLCFREAAEKEIKLMDQLGIWEPVKQSEWAHPLVVVGKEQPGEVRITTDLSYLNKFVVPERHPIPHIKDLFLQLKGSTIFSKLDLRKGYFHIPLHPDSRPLTTTATPLGLRQYCRLPMGLTDSASVFQRSITQALSGLPGVIFYIDDLIVHGSSDQEHSTRLKAVLKRLEERGFHLQLAKCLVNQKEIPAFGHILSKDDIRPHPKNLEPLKSFPVPTSVQGVQSFMGLINFFGDFLPHLATTAEPLRHLTRKKVPFEWSPECQQAFESLKNQALAAQTLTIFDPNLFSIVTTDASEVGIGAILTQRDSTGKESMIACFSQTLSNSERNYSATEREALAVIRSLEHWDKLLLGRHIEVRTDHQALTSALHHPKDRRQSSKFTRWLERLEAFDVSLVYIKGKDNSAADALSRIPSMGVKSVRLADMKAATISDPEAQAVKHALEKGWPDGKTLRLIAPFKSVSADLSFKDDLLYFRNRIFVPISQRPSLLAECHKGHPGIERFKRLLKSEYWWPGLCADAEKVVKGCQGCIFSAKSKPPHPPLPGKFPVPDIPGSLYNLDITGPFFNGHYLVVLIDATTNFTEVLDTKITTSGKIIFWLDGVFSRVGYPSGIITDNGPQFISHEFRSFLQSHDIFHHLTPIYTPQDNGRVEVFNRTLKHGVQAFKAENTPWDVGLLRIITSHRHTPGIDGESPADKFFGRKVRRPGSLNLQTPTRPVSLLTEGVMKGFYKVGDLVLYRLPHVLKGLPPYGGPLRVTEIISYFRFRLEDGQVYHARRLKPYRPSPIQYYDFPPSDEPPAGPLAVHLGNPLLPRRSSRWNKGQPPDRYQSVDFRRGGGY